MPSRLGYRGFIIQEENTEVLVLGKDTKNLQHKLLLTMPECLIPIKVLKRVFAAIESGSVMPVVKATKPKRYVPPFFGVQRLFASAARTRKNNCYNYANIKITNSFAQPGLGSGRQFELVTKERIQAAAIRDGLATVPHSRNPRDPLHVVALAVEDCKYQSNSPVGSIFQILTILLIDPL